MSDPFRSSYSELSEVQVRQIKDIKEVALELYTIFDVVVQPDERSERARCLSLAKTKLEEAVMWAVKGASA